MNPPACSIVRVFAVSLLLLSLLAWGSGRNTVHADSPLPAESDPTTELNAADLLPESTITFAKVDDLGGVVQRLLNHSLRTKIEALPVYKELVRSGQLNPLQIGMSSFQASMGRPWPKAIGLLADRGLTVSLDSNKGGVALLLHSSDRKLLERFRGFVLALRQLQGTPAEQGTYRGFVADLVSEDLKMVRMDDWMLFTNQSDLGKSIIDQYLDRDGNTLASTPGYIAARKQLASAQDGDDTDPPAVVAYFDVETFRRAGVAEELFREKIDNLVVEMALGGVLSTLRNTPLATAQLDLNPSGMSLTVATPHQREWEAPREYFFGEPHLATAPALISVPDRLFALSTHRDLSQMWLRAGDLVTVKVVDELAVA
ncbi:MAG: hypothetical protein AAFN70_05425, partial [Planctomycetota bacterium]